MGSLGRDWLNTVEPFSDAPLRATNPSETPPSCSFVLDCSSTLSILDFVVDKIRRLALANRWKVDLGHAAQRMEERGVTIKDVRHGLINGTSARLQDNGRWKLKTVDLDGDDLMLICVVTDEVLVVTVF